MFDYFFDIMLFSDDKNIDKFNDIEKEIYIVFVFMIEILCIRYWVNYNNIVMVNNMLFGNGLVILVFIFIVMRV